MQAHDEMKIRLTVDGVRVITTLGSFLAANPFTKTEEKYIREALKANKPAYGGGGAMVQWKAEAWNHG